MNLPADSPGLSTAAARSSLLIGAVAVLLCVLAAPFGTAALGVPQRLLFWTLLIAINNTKWFLWYHHLADRTGQGWQAALLMVVVGAILLNVTLPFEIRAVFRLVGVDAPIAWAPTFCAALAVSLAIGAGIAVVRRGAGHEVPGSVGPAPAPGGLAARAGLIDLHSVRVVIAEDHYLRLRLADGRSPLVLYRFGDALRELAGCDGQQVHRGTWVAAAAVVGAFRDGRRWRLQLTDGSTVPVSTTFVAAIRTRGWSARAGRGTA